MTDLIIGRVKSENLFHLTGLYNKDKFIWPCYSRRTVMTIEMAISLDKEIVK